MKSIFDFFLARLATFIFAFLCTFILFVVFGYTILPLVVFISEGHTGFPKADSFVDYAYLSLIVGTVAVLASILDLAVGAVKKFMKDKDENK